MDLKNLFIDGILVDINISYWGAQKKLNENDIGLDEVSEAFSLGKKYLIPKDIMHNFKLIESRARALIEDSSYSFPIGSARFIPKKKFEKVIVMLKTYQDSYNALVDDLVTNYDGYKAQMKPVYEAAAEEAYKTKAAKDGLTAPNKENFIAEFMARIHACYPAVDGLRKKFGIELSVFEVTLPEFHAGSAENAIAQESIAQEYRKEMQTKISSFVDEVVKTLRAEAVKVCQHISNNIAEGKIIKSTTINSLTSFIDKFKDMNFVGDQSIEAALEKVKKELIDLHSTSEFTDNVELKVELKRHLDKIVEEASSITDISSITGQYRRKVQWQD
jgi:hypothetical protein